MSQLDHFTQQLAAAAQLPNTARPSAYRDLLTHALAQPATQLDHHALLQLAAAYLQNAVFSDQNSTGGGLVVGRQALSLFAHHIATAAAAAAATTAHNNDDRDMHDADLPAIANPDVRKSILQDALERLQPRVLSFEEQASVLRSQLSSLLEADEDWIEAARVLQQIPLDSGHRSVSDHYKLTIYMRIVRLLVEGDDPVGADVFLKRASMIIHNVPGALASHSASAPPASSAATTTTTTTTQDAKAESQLEDPKVLGLQFKLCQARIYDAQRRFAEAAVRYHELSYVAEIDEGDRNMMLSAAVTASILSPAGPQRARTLATLIRDERTQSLPQYTILSKVFLDHIIRPYEIEAFEKLLAPHQVAKLAPSSSAHRQTVTSAAAVAVAVAASGNLDTDMVGDEALSSSHAAPRSAASTRHGPSTVLDRAMIEHNLLSASRLYDNITLGGLGSLLDLSPAGAEETARRMIQQGRLKAWIDQVGGGRGEGIGGAGGVVHFIDQERRGEAGTVAGGLGGATSTSPEAQSNPSAVGGGGAEGGGDSATATATAAGSGENFTSSTDRESKYTRRWDYQIARTAGKLEEVCLRVVKSGVAQS